MATRITGLKMKVNVPKLYLRFDNKIKIKDLNDVKIDVGPLAQVPSPPTLRTPTLKLARVKPRLT